MPDQVEYGTVLFDGVAFPVVQDVGYQALLKFDGKTVSGDYSRDSDDLISAKIWTGFPGGIGVLNNRDGSDEGKAWYSSVWSRDPYKMTLNRKAVTVAASPAVKYPLGDLAGVFYAATTTTVHPWNETTDTFGAALTNALAGAPVMRATAWNGKLYIPCGTAGYHSCTATTVSAVNTGALAVEFAAMGQDNRLFALCTDGALKSTLDGVNWQTDAQLNTSETPRHMVVWMDRTETDTLFIVTSAGTYAFDPNSGILIRTRISNVPAHPDNGLGMATWRPGEDLYLSFGLQVGQYAAGLGQIAFMGPDRRDGLPDELRGRIVDLCPEFNQLFALVEGLTVVTTGTPLSEFDPGHEDEPTELSGGSAVSALLAYNGFGWHTLWQSNTASGSPTWCCVSGSEYRVWWGWGSRLLTIKLSRPFSNPDQEFRTGEGNFEATGQIDSGYFDGNMREFDKLASHVEINMSENGASATETVGIEYRCDNDTDWTLLGTVNSWQDSTTFPFNVVTQTDGSLFSEGCAFRKFRWRATLNRNPMDATKTPILDSIVLKHIRLPLAGASFSLTVPLYVGPEGWGGRTAEHIKEELDALAIKRGFIRMQHNDDSFRVRIAYINGSDRTGDDDRGSRTFTLVEVRLPGYQG